MSIETIRDLSDNRFAYYYLSHIEALGAISIMNIRNNLADICEVFDMSAGELGRLVGLNEKQISGLKLALDCIDELYTEYRRLDEKGIKMLLYDDEEYPLKLKDINSSPMVLYYKGDLPDNDTPSVAIVGSRQATNYGISMTEYFAEELSNAGIHIISGMASGIDGAAHRGCLRTESGRTWAVLGSGVNICYPKENFYIYNALSNDEPRGGIISETVPGMTGLKKFFPMRNRIISGLSDIVLIMEAREKSGSLITADIAIEQNKDLFALPGRITDPLSRGTNSLIEQGAFILKSPENVLELLGLRREHKLKETEKNVNLLAKDEKRVYSALDLSARHIEDIVNETGIPYGRVSSILLSLELKGYITQLSAQYYAII